MSTERKYEFNWDLVGDLNIGRPNLGNQTRVEVYRLMMFSFRDILEQRYGNEEADNIFYEAGKMAGKNFYQHVIGEQADFNEFIKRLQQVLKDFAIGLMRVEKADLEGGNIIVSVAEDLDCSGLPETGYEVCKFDEGFIAGILESFTHKSFVVKEVDCWCTGDRTCRFSAELVK